jgi:hypothetical protein
VRAKCQRTYQQTITRLGALVTILLLAACNRTTPTVASPSPTAVATSAVATSAVAPSAVAPTELPTVALPTVTPTLAANAPTPDTVVSAVESATTEANGETTIGAIFTSPRFSYTVVLPCCWLALPTPGTAIESALADLDEGEELPLWGDLAERMRERENGALMELIALLPDEENVALPIAQVTVSVLPTYGMTLDDYATATSAELTRIANTSVQSAYIEPSLGVEEFPAAVIEYTATPSPANGDEAEQSIAGMQVAFFGNDAESLIVLTFTTTVDRFEELKPEFLHIVRSVTLHDPTL